MANCGITNSKKIRDEMNIHEYMKDVKNYIVNAKDEKKEINVIIKDTLDIIKKGIKINE